MIELVMVLILLGVLAVFAAPRFLVIDDLNARGFHDETLAYLRYAHKTAIAQRRTVCVNFTVSSAVLTIAAVEGSTSCAGNPLRGPRGESPATVSTKPGVAYSVAPTSFNFNGLGQPIDSGTGAPLGTQTIQVTGASGSITIESETGYVHE